MMRERTQTPNRRWTRVTVAAQVIAAIGVVLLLRDVCQDADARAREVSLSLQEAAPGGQAQLAFHGRRAARRRCELHGCDS